MLACLRAIKIIDKFRPFSRYIHIVFVQYLTKDDGSGSLMKYSIASLRYVLLNDVQKYMHLNQNPHNHIGERSL